jgi:hypothetical protein
MSSGVSVAENVIDADHQVAVLVPCYNEQHAVAKVVADFRAALPAAAVYVYDNNSTDKTVEVARSAGAIVRRETYQGKGHVVRRMFNDIEADIYVLVDGDATYDAASAPAMVGKLLAERLDMVVATRVEREQAAYRVGHRAGNRILTGFVAHMFGQSFTDILSGYRVFSRRFVKSFPVLSGGFEIETELTVHALELELLVGEVSTPYYSRPLGSEALSGRAAVVAVRRLRDRARHRVDRARHPDLHHLRARRTGATLSHRNLVDRPHAACIPVDCGRPRPRYSHARPPRAQASCLSRLARAGRRAAAELNMRELVRTNDAVLITAIEALLNGADIKHLVVDRNMSVLEGSIGIFPRRILVAEEEFDAARQLLEEAGFADELRPDGR